MVCWSEVFVTRRAMRVKDVVVAGQIRMVLMWRGDDKLIVVVDERSSEASTLVCMLRRRDDEEQRRRNIEVDQKFGH
ncbi:unnamed protein product [Nippostrongylus brasiliensis]|uniref:Uncharacterized protein n=1 Tax=Nippostrongylus brasiliensis TaxID=27835 RepID=A0A0N4YCJ9_NIPBR|nr:unnamed protein product [Nippostrongylus brasiliensis]